MTAFSFANISSGRVMESTLHHQLKTLYGGSDDGVEVRVDGFRIDAVVKGKLYEIQQASLSALRSKVRTLLESHSVVVVKPLSARRLLIRHEQKDGPVVSSRYSPLRETLYHLFVDLVYFIDLFPHRRLTIEAVLIEQEEHRSPRVLPRRRRFGRDYHVDDRVLTRVVSKQSLKTLNDLRALLPPTLPNPFTTEELAREASIPRWVAQKMAYCLRKTGAVALAGKKGRSMLYSRPATRRRKAA